MLKIKNIKYTPIANINIKRTPNHNVTSLTEDIFSKFFRFVRALYYANIKYR